jgi:oligoribonuclease NrnB/cAMP/cGMP phosphodiesterase (DHH superfamily)
MNRNRGTAFSVWTVPICYKQENWSNELIVEQVFQGTLVSWVDIHQASIEFTKEKIRAKMDIHQEKTEATITPFGLS